MADSKKYDGSQWEHSLRKLTTATEAVENPLYSDGTAITSYTIKGNTVQNGTPTPDNPVDVVGVGVRTENLFDISSAVRYEYVITNTSPGIIKNGTLSAYAGAFCYVIKASPGVTYTLKVHSSDTVPVIRAGFYSLPVPSREDGIVHDGTEARNRIPNPTITITNSGNYPYLILQISGMYVQYLTITASSTPPASFIPYGYKIPISSGGVTTNIYLGSTQTTRQIEKITFDGSDDEGWYLERINSYGIANFGLSNAIRSLRTGGLNWLSNRFVPQSSLIAQTKTEGILLNTQSACFIRIDSTTVSTLTAFKQWLSENPVDVWYALATSETGIVNEPLMKIGDYADTVSNATAIPTTEGANSITVDTTVQPSEFTATWTGWHDSSVKEWDGSEWQ